MTVSESANVLTVKKLYTAMGQPTPEAMFALLTEDVEFVVPGPPGLGAAGNWRGADGVSECLRRLRHGQETQSLEFHEFVSEGDHVVVRLHVRGKAIATGRSYESDIIHFFTLRDGKVARLLDFFDTAQLAAAFG
jgi:ketosteroid isomerase-like protein